MTAGSLSEGPVERCALIRDWWANDLSAANSDTALAQMDIAFLAAELARVTAENARLRDALERIADPAIMEMCSTSRPHPWVYVARIALGGTEGP